MPGGDRTGPMGQGVMTGRGAGFCNQNNNSDLGFRMFGRGRGCAKGMGRGMGRGFAGFAKNQPMSKDAQISALENEIKILSSRLETLKKED